MENEITDNPFREGTKAYLFLEIANINYNTGFSRNVKKDEFPKDLELGNGGSWCRDDGPLGTHFNIVRKKEKGKIISVKLEGYKKNNFNHNIPLDIYNKLKKERCCFIDTTHSIEVDHKDGRYDNYMNKPEEKDLQPVHTTVNKVKRQHCKECKETSIRYDARRLGFSVPQFIGLEMYSGSCIGCYWHDPHEFRKQISKNYKKEN